MSHTMEAHDFSKLNPLSTINELEKFKTNYPRSSHIPTVNSYIARKSADSFNVNSTQAEYEHVRALAETPEIKAYVENKITANENKKREYAEARRLEEQKRIEALKREESARKARERQERREENGGLFRLGIDIFDLGYNFKKQFEERLKYDIIGVKFQFGNYADRVQIGIEAKAGLVGYKDTEEVFRTKFNIPVEAYAKLNLFKTGSVWWFAQGKFRYNALKDDELTLPYAWNVGLGWAGKHVDFNFYYEKEFGTNNMPSWRGENGTFFVGACLGFYFKAF